MVAANMQLIAFRLPYKLIVPPNVLTWLLAIKAVLADEEGLSISRIPGLSELLLNRFIVLFVIYIDPPLLVTLMLVPEFAAGKRLRMAPERKRDLQKNAPEVMVELPTIMPV